jgi:hypothetical protein
VRVDEEVGAVAEGDRGAELAAEALVGDLQQLDRGAAGARCASMDRDERVELGVAVGVPQAQRLVGAGAGGEEEREGEREQGEGGAAELLA